MIGDGGVWVLPVLACGLFSVVIAAMNLSKQQVRLGEVASRLALAALLLGIAGTCMGLYGAGVAFAGDEPSAVSSATVVQVMGIASVPTFLAALLGGLSYLIAAFGVFRSGAES